LATTAYTIRRVAGLPHHTHGLASPARVGEQGHDRLPLEVSVAIPAALGFSMKGGRSMESQQAPVQASRSRGALYGLYIADSLAMPVHWYYDRKARFRDYGWIADYLTPKNPHSDSILWRSYTAPNRKGEILHDQARHWGKKGVHYHQFLQAGENTLNLQLCSLLIESLNENGLYNPADYLGARIGSDQAKRSTDVGLGSKIRSSYGLKEMFLEPK